MRKYYTLFVVTLFLATMSQAQVYVSQFAVNGNNDGTSWGDAYLELSTAIHNAAPGDELWVALGEYFPSPVILEDYDEGIYNDTTHAFVIDKDIKIYGGFIGNEISVDQRNPLLNPVILNGDMNRDDISSRFDTLKNDNARHILYITDTVTNASIIDGLFLWRGYANNDTTYGGTEGGGIYCEGTPTIQNCTVNSCFAQSGGGIYLYGGTDINNDPIGTVTISSCDVDMNRSSGFGAGIYGEMVRKLIIEDTKISRNQCSGEAAIYLDEMDSVQIDRSIIRDNDAKFYSALYALDVANVSLTETEISGNHADAFTVFVEQNDVNLFLQCKVLSNTADSAFAGIYSEDQLIVINSAVAGNEAESDVIAGQIVAGSEITLLHSTVAGSVGPTIVTEGAGLMTTNSIIYSETGNAYEGGMTILSSGGNICSDGSMDIGLIEASDMTTTDPLFSDVAGGDFTLQMSSPAIDAAVPSLIVVDVDGITRDTAPDIGAYEYVLSATSQTEIPELSIELWPTVTKDYIQLKYTGNDLLQFEYQIIDMQGRVHVQSRMVDRLQQVDVQNLSVGQYQMIFRSEKGITTRSFIKQ